MGVLTSLLDVSSETYATNRAVQLDAIAALDEQLELTIAGGGERYTAETFNPRILITWEHVGTREAWTPNGTGADA